MPGSSGLPYPVGTVLQDGLVVTGYNPDGTAIYGLDPGTGTGTVAEDFQTLAANLELAQLQAAQDRAKEIHNVWLSLYLGCELDTLFEVSSIPFETVDYAGATARVLSENNQAFAQAAADVAAFNAINCLTDVCGSGNRLALVQTMSGAFQVEGELRFLEVNSDLNNATRRNARLIMLNLGRNGVAAAAQAAATAASIYGSVASAAKANSSDGIGKYLMGRGLQFFKDNQRNIASWMGGATTTPYQSNGGQPMYGLDTPMQAQVDTTSISGVAAASQAGAYDGISGNYSTTGDIPYQYDTGAALYGTDTPAMSSIPATDWGSLNFIYN